MNVRANISISAKLILHRLVVTEMFIVTIVIIMSPHIYNLIAVIILVFLEIVQLEIIKMKDIHEIFGST